MAVGDRYDQPMISHVEAGRKSLRFEGLVNAAKELEISTDYLVGLTDAPTPAAELSIGAGTEFLAGMPDSELLSFFADDWAQLTEQERSLIKDRIQEVQAMLRRRKRAGP